MSDGMTSLGEVFSDREVALLYRRRAPYPDELVSKLESLLVPPRTILDIGAGTGSLARRMVPFADRVDAVDPSAPMIREGRRLPGGYDRRLRWIRGRAEEAALSPPYGLITAGRSLHWLHLGMALPRLRDALAPDAVMAVADTEDVDETYRPDVLAVIRHYSEVEQPTETPDLMDELAASGRFAIEGRLRTAEVPFEQSIDDFLEMLHSTSSLARVRLGDRAPRFDADVRAVLERHGVDAVSFGVVGLLIWGRPT